MQLHFSGYKKIQKIAHNVEQVFKSNSDVFICIALRVEPIGAGAVGNMDMDTLPVNLMVPILTKLLIKTIKNMNKERMRR